MVNIWQLITAVLSGGVGLAIINRLISNSKYKAEVRKIDVESDGLAAKEWQALYFDLKKDQMQLLKEFEEMKKSFEDLRLEHIKLQHQVNFSDI